MRRKLNRREVLFSGGACAAGLFSATGCGGALADKNTVSHSTYREPERDVPIVERADVVVCGAGPAGIAAAIAAARTGANTHLLETHGCLGGIWTAGMMSRILDDGNKSGLMRQIISNLHRRTAKYGHELSGGQLVYDVEDTKLLLEEMCIKAGVKVQLHTRVVAAAKDSANRVALAVTESKSGRQGWASQVFVDATGDGDLAAYAGCGFDYGRPADDLTQPMSLIILLTGIDFERVEPFVRTHDKPVGLPKQRLLSELQRAGVTPSFTRPSLFCVHRDLFILMANHEYGYSALSAADVTEATLRARAENHRIVDGLRSLGGIWKDIRIVATGEQIGTREGRRIHGYYTVSEEDLKRGARHKDAVCRVTYGVDVHSPSKEQGSGSGDTGIRSKPYDIPYRALIAREVDGLLLAGRCVSGDFIAHASYRVTGNAVAMGQAAGTAAALAALDHRLPQDVPWGKIESAMSRLV